MSDSFNLDSVAIGELPDTTERARTSTNALGVSATQFAGAMRKAFGDAVAGGKQFDDVLKSLALRLSKLALANAFKPLFRQLTGGLGEILGYPGATPPVSPGVSPFASGGIIGAPSYFPLPSGGLGLAGEAGPEAIVPLTRGSDGRLGIGMAGAAPASITVQIMTPDLASFQRSEAYLTGHIARAVARGQRNL
jgi:phage-related minor tail protein